MEFVLDRDTLAEAVSWAARTLSPRPAIPLLAGVQITAKEDSVVFASYDYETSSQVTVKANEVKVPGSALVSGKLLAEIAKSLPNNDKSVSFEIKDTALAIKCGSFSSQLITMLEEEYPQTPDFPAVNGSVEASELVHAVSQVASSTSRDDSLPILTCICLKMDGQNLTMLATDRYRLAMKQIPWQANSADFSWQVLLKGKNFSDATKSLVGSGSIDLAVDMEDEKRFGLAVAGRFLTLRLYDGDYPDTTKLFPQEFNAYAICKRSEILEAIKRVSLVSVNHQIRLKFTEGSVLISANGTGENEASESLYVDYTGEDLSIVFNYRYLVEGISLLDDDFVRLSFVNGTSPAVIMGQEQAEGEPSEDYKYLLMPIRLVS